MNEKVAYCGLTCHDCGIYLATKEKNDEKKREMKADIVEQIKEHYGQDCKLEDVTDCDGCKSDKGRLFSGCRKCEIRKCARWKGVENCAHCDEYACEKLEKFFIVDPEAKEQLDAIRSKL